MDISAKHGKNLEQTTTDTESFDINVPPRIQKHYVFHWQKIHNGPNTSGITRMDVARAGSGALSFDAFGRCHPTDCGW